MAAEQRLMGPTRAKQKRWLIIPLAGLLLLLLFCHSQTQVITVTAAATINLTACDQLFNLYENLSDYCQCREQETDFVKPLEVAGASINHLDCSPNSLRQLIEDLNLPRSKESPQRSLQIDYLNVNTNVSSDFHLNPARLEKNRFSVDHLSLLLKLDGQESKSLQEQLLDLSGKFYEGNLQFLSILIEQEDDGKSTVPNGRSQALEMTEFLDKFKNLTRLELNSLNENVGWSLGDRDLLADKTRLNWLNLANSNLKFSAQNPAQRPFRNLKNLEYLNLEHCNLDKFPFFSHFDAIFSLKSRQEPHYYHGMKNLTSLNLASNRIRSLEFDLFSTFHGKDAIVALDAKRQHLLFGQREHERNFKSSNVFLLPSLNQLDLSFNRISDISIKAGQYILFAMPNLNQLYLQHNQIKQINLGSLLFATNLIPRSMFDANDIEDDAKFVSADAVLSSPSQLEYLDLSFNQLERIISIQEESGGNYSSSSKLKYINLAHNNLKRTLNLLDSKLINRIVFEESLRTDDNSSSPSDLRHLESLFMLHGQQKFKPSLCDFVWPSATSISNEYLADDALIEVIYSSNKLQTVDRDFASDKCNWIQVLKLASNEITTISYQEAFATMIKLEQLDLSYNRLVQLPERVFSKNSQLEVLNLAHNRFKLLDKATFVNLVKLKELILNDNEIVKFSPETNLNRLKYLDIKYNTIKSISNFTNSKPISPKSSKNSETQSLEEGPKYHLYLNDQSVSIDRIDQNKSDEVNYQMYITNFNETSILSSRLSKFSHNEIRFCTIDSKQSLPLKHLCLIDEDGERCLPLRIHKNVVSCLTNLEDGSSKIVRALNKTEDSNRLVKVQKNFDQEESQNLISPMDEDPVLSFINSVKENWLKLRELNLYEYLIHVTNLKDLNSVYFNINGIPIYTITLLKLAIIGGSICIILLLITVFVLLTTSSNKNHSSPTSSSETTITTSDTITTSNNTSNSTSSSHLMSSSNLSTSRSSTETGDQQTVLERRASSSTSNRPNPNQMNHLQQVQCSTPSSSIAPSSVETGETLQAIDSIQSNQMYPEQQSQQQPIATVMRMVKSSSVNQFNAYQARASNDMLLHNNYGTLSNPRHINNYSLLKSKIKNMQQKQQQIYSVQNELLAPTIADGYPALNVPTGIPVEDREDPTTLSLLSLNSALSASASNGQNQASQQQIGFQTDDFPINVNLCHYHRGLQNQQHTADIILEQDELMLNPQFHMNAATSQNYSGNILPPPPPSSRAIEVLENPVQLFSQNFSQNT